MTKAPMLTLLVVVTHWVVAVWHLFLAAKVLPAPNNTVSWLAITLITLGHMGVSVALWKLSDKFAGLVSLIFFLGALGADLYEHFLHASLNNIFMVTSGDWTALFKVSVFVLLALEILGCSLAVPLLRCRTRNNSQPKFVDRRVLPQVCAEQHLAAAGLIEAAGNLNRMRFSEVRLLQNENRFSLERF